MTPDPDDFLECIEAHRNGWDAVDEVLYALCEKHPTHSRLPGVQAKVLLIGRGFATGVERHIYSEKTQGSSISTLVRHLHSHHREADEIVSRLRKIREPLDIEKLEAIVVEHGKFCRLLSKISRKENSLASFASKYLHFHSPTVPIYDSWVCNQAWRMRDKNGLQAFNEPNAAHSGYYWYSLCFWQMYCKLRAVTPKANVRLAEIYLLWLAS
jgi:hypothetical protein